MVAAEDTRQTRKLLSAHDLRASLVSLHAQSTEAKIERLIDQLEAGESVAYATDAGSPAVSDPGVALVAAAHQRSIPVRSIPGPSAVTAALAVAGLKSNDFRFLGFLPRGAGRRKAMLDEAGQAGCALVVFESPRRARSLLEQVEEVLPGRSVALCRELTKLHEEVLRGPPAEVLELLGAEPRGEITLVIEAGDAPERREPKTADLMARADELAHSGKKTRQIAKTLAAETGLSRKRIYQMLIESKE